MPFYPKMLRAKERGPTPYPFVVFTFRLTIVSIKEFGGASCCVIYLTKNVLQLLSVCVKMCRSCGFLVTESSTCCCSLLNFIMEMCG